MRVSASGQSVVGLDAFWVAGCLQSIVNGVGRFETLKYGFTPKIRCFNFLTVGHLVGRIRANGAGASVGSAYSRIDSWVITTTSVVAEQ